MPLSSRSPRSSKSMPDPATRSATVSNPSTSPPSASAATRAPCSQRFRELAIESRVRSVIEYLRGSPFRGSTCQRASRRQQMARARPIKAGKEPVTRIDSRPQNRAALCARRRYSATSETQARSPSETGVSVEPTMSVKRLSPGRAQVQAHPSQTRAHARRRRALVDECLPVAERGQMHRFSRRPQKAAGLWICAAIHSSAPATDRVVIPLGGEQRSMNPGDEEEEMCRT